MNRVLARIMLVCAAMLCALPLARAEGEAKQFLWEVKSKDNTIYLFGALGMGSREMYPMNPAVESAYADSEVVVVESDTSDDEAFNEASLASYYKGTDSIESHIAPELYKELRAYHEENGLDWDQARNMKPYMLAFALVNREIEKIGYESRMDSPFYFIYRAKRDRKPVLESLSPALQEGMLRGAMTGVSKGTWKKLLESEVDAWRAGELVRYEEIDRASYDDIPDGSALRRKMVEDREPQILDKLVGMLSAPTPKKHFVVVAASFLVGGNGLITALRSKGFEIRQM